MKKASVNKAKKVQRRCTERGQSLKLKGQSGVGGHGAAFLPKVKGRSSGGIINKETDRERYNNTFIQTYKCTQATTGVHYTGSMWLQL